uniref:RNA-directed DNA polymerase, eukaryota, reverse transcriptase zinc-binding domain protein n=1 Tax=Tanacetum cinerariifolium TaxID=118510 RepID=A0A6L2J7N4_TANCI|nr:hypothetical protein [Tanacetum cinerariifolium]
MFSLASKLKMLKKPDRKLKFSQRDLADKVNVLKDRLCKVQEVMVREPFNAEIRAVEVVALKAYISAVKDDELFLKQKSKITWLSEGDFNTKDGCSMHELASLFVNKLSLVDAELMVKPVSLEEIKDVRFSMNDDKAPGPDGYSARFFKAAWSVVGYEFPQNDLMIFSHGDLNSVKVIKSALDEFTRIFCLKPIGSFPFKYLGVPIISSKLCKHHCSPLIEKVKMRLLNWKNKSLLFAGRLQLIKSVISSLQVYWSSVFILPKFVYNEIKKLMKNFLWSQGNSHRGKAKMKWKDVCNLKEQGGLGIKSLHLWNVALMSKHI